MSALTHGKALLQVAKFLNLANISHQVKVSLHHIYETRENFK